MLFDFGEANAVALASTLGIAALVTDDTKEYGPHYSLKNEYIEDVIPFCFYELLYLQYLESDNDFCALQEQFEHINNIAYPEYPMSFLSRIKRVVKRFGKNGTNRDQKWLESFCLEKDIDYHKKMKELKDNLLRLDM